MVTKELCPNEVTCSRKKYHWGAHTDLPALGHSKKDNLKDTLTICEGNSFTNPSVCQMGKEQLEVSLGSEAPVSHFLHSPSILIEWVSVWSRYTSQPVKCAPVHPRTQAHTSLSYLAKASPVLHTSEHSWLMPTLAPVALPRWPQNSMSWDSSVHVHSNSSHPTKAAPAQCTPEPAQPIPNLAVLPKGPGEAHKRKKHN